MAEAAQMEQLFELQKKSNELRRHIMQISGQLASSQKEREIVAITVGELERMPAGTKTYRAIGNMFAMTDRKDLSHELAASAADSAKRDESRKTLKDQFQGKLVEVDAQAESLAITMQKNPAFKKPLAAGQSS